MGKIVITGTGRCGTSFLMHLFTELGLNTGYSIGECEQHLFRSKCNGGIEHSIGTEIFEKSDIVKNPDWIYNPTHLDFDIKYIIVPVRQLDKVAQSRSMNENYGGFLNGIKTVDDQMTMDSRAFYHFIDYVVKADIELILLDFPRIIHDSEYLFKKIGHKLGVYLKPWNSSFNEIANPEKVHV